MENKLGTMKIWELVLGWICLPMMVLGTQLVVGVVLALMGYDLYAEGTLLTLNVWNSVINLVLVVAVFHRFLFGQLRRIKGNVGRFFGSVALGYAIYIGLTVLFGIVQGILRETFSLDYVNQNQDTVEQFIQSDVLRSVIIVTLCAPIVEECLLRGLIFRPLYPRSRVLAYGLSMLVFSFLHVYASLLEGGVSFGTVLLNILTYLPAGFVLAWVYERTKTIWASILLHLTINTVSLLLLTLLQPLVGQLRGA